jgi:hypothetical protein
MLFAIKITIFSISIILYVLQKFPAISNSAPDEHLWKHPEVWI